VAFKCAEGVLSQTRIARRSARADDRSMNDTLIDAAQLAHLQTWQG